MDFIAKNFTSQVKYKNKQREYKEQPNSSMFIDDKFTKFTKLQNYKYTKFGTKQPSQVVILISMDVIW